ncbi:GNAT family protein [uncultured Ferrimonas sp.]|uniref:GNAT family N-acetyltransferase n=1 Tax=uncultured Ferrimonas sp. TaxID=432640 RepID=UPI00262FF9B2|nr:GNAT family protein [uncultured Ferrimonas sp.]
MSAIALSPHHQLQPLDAASATAFIATQAAQPLQAIPAAPACAHWGVVRDNQCIGIVALHQQQLTVLLQPQARQQGLATLALRAVRDWAFSQQGLNRLTAALPDSDKAGKRLLEKCGFGRSHKEYGYYDNQQDRCWFGIDLAQWQRSQQVAAQ